MKKTMAVVFVLTLMVSIIAAAQSLTAIAAPGDASALSAEVKLYAGRYNTSTKVFTPLKAGEMIKQGEDIAVRIAPKTDYLVGASRYVVMFDKAFFTIVGGANSAFTVNSDKNNIDLDSRATLPGYSGNYYYDFACTGFAGTTSANINWPAKFLPTDKEKYQAVAVGTQASSNAINGGYPEILAGNWLFQFRLKATQDINADAAQIWMDSSWFRSNSNTGAECYIAKCLEGQLASSAGNNYNFNYNFTGANIRLALTVNQVIPTTAPTTNPPSTSDATTKPGMTTTSIAGQTTKPGDMAASTDMTQSTAAPATTAEPVKVPQQDLDAAVDKAGIKDWDGNMANLTPEQKEAVQGYLEENGKDVEARDDGFYYVETTVPGDTATNADGSPLATDSSADDGVTRSQKTIIIIATVTAVFGTAAIAVILARKKK